MAENTINDFNTLPEQVQINKEDIKTNTADIAKLKDDIGKIKPNAWEERKFNAIDEDGYSFEITTYNPVTDINAPVNIQKSFTDKDTYSFSDTTNSYSFAISFKTNSFGTLADWFMYAVCGDPSLTINDYKNLLTGTSKNAILFVGTKENDSASIPSYYLYINCDQLITTELKFYTSDLYIDTIAVTDDKSIHSILTSSAVDQFYLKKSDASNTYLSKTDASNTYVTKVHADTTYLTKQDYEESIDKGDIQFTTQGWTKFKAITDTEGQTITLSVPGDLLEHVQVTGTNDLKLQLVYNSHAVFENIYLHPNNSINNLDYITGAKSTYFTGQAVLTLSTQSEALFYIVYQETTGITLHLITTF